MVFVRIMVALSTFPELLLSPIRNRRHRGEGKKVIGSSHPPASLVTTPGPLFGSQPKERPYLVLYLHTLGALPYCLVLEPLATSCHQHFSPLLYAARKIVFL